MVKFYTMRQQIVTGVADNKEINKCWTHFTTNSIKRWNYLSIKSWTSTPWMLMGNTIDDRTTSRHCEAYPFGVSAPIISHTRCPTRFNFILNLYQRNSIYSIKRATELKKKCQQQNRRWLSWNLNSVYTILFCELMTLWDSLGGYNKDVKAYPTS